jgi:hypothetical protein
MHAIADASIPTRCCRCFQCNAIHVAPRPEHWQLLHKRCHGRPASRKRTPHRTTAQSTSGTRNYSTANALSGRKETTIVMLTSVRRKLKIFLRRMLREEWLAGGTAMHRSDSQTSKRWFSFLSFPRLAILIPSVFCSYRLVIVVGDFANLPE